MDFNCLKQNVAVILNTFIASFEESEIQKIFIPDFEGKQSFSFETSPLSLCAEMSERKKEIKIWAETEMGYKSDGICLKSSFDPIYLITMLRTMMSMDIQDVEREYYTRIKNLAMNPNMDKYVFSGKKAFDEYVSGYEYVCKAINSERTRTSGNGKLKDLLCRYRKSMSSDDFDMMIVFHWFPNEYAESLYSGMKMSVSDFFRKRNIAYDRFVTDYFSKKKNPFSESIESGRYTEQFTSEKKRIEKHIYEFEQSVQNLSMECQCPKNLTMKEPVFRIYTQKRVKLFRNTLKHLILARNEKDISDTVSLFLKTAIENERSFVDAGTVERFFSVKNISKEKETIKMEYLNELLTIKFNEYVKNGIVEHDRRNADEIAEKALGYGLCFIPLHYRDEFRNIFSDRLSEKFGRNIIERKEQPEQA